MANGEALDDVVRSDASGFGDLLSDFDAAVKYYVLAFKAGCLPAFDNLGTHYETSVSGKAPDRINYEKALHYYRAGMQMRCAKSCRRTAPRRLCALALRAGLAFGADPALKRVFDAVGICLEQYTMHDPSGLVTEDARQFVAAIGKAQEDGCARGLETWHRANPMNMWAPAQCLFVEKPH